MTNSQTDITCLRFYEILKFKILYKTKQFQYVYNGAFVEQTLMIQRVACGRALCRELLVPCMESTHLSSYVLLLDRAGTQKCRTGEQSYKFSNFLTIFSHTGRGQ